MSAPPSRAAEPKRLIRRHHYQQGPGFLFLATRGGRPAGDRLRPSLTPVRERMRAFRLAREGGVAAAYRATGCSRASLYRWLAAYQTHDIADLRDELSPAASFSLYPGMGRARGRHHPPSHYWNSERIAAEMKRRQI